MTAHIEISHVTRRERRAAAALGARSLAGDPSTYAMFGPELQKRLRGCRAIYTMVLATARRPAIAARQDGKLVGIVVLSAPGQCLFRQPVHELRIGQRRIRFSLPPSGLHHLLPIAMMGGGALQRVSRAGDQMMSHDPAEPHGHLELVAVDAGLQGQGIGSRMLEAAVADMDTFSTGTHLETDTPENVRFYRKFGFEVREEASVLDVATSFMWRPLP
ncbi:MAG: GNAT family N-acetyltransferase [Chloroflexota bacterium]